MFCLCASHAAASSTCFSRPAFLLLPWQCLAKGTTRRSCAWTSTRRRSTYVCGPRRPRFVNREPQHGPTAPSSSRRWPRATTQSCASTTWRRRRWLACTAIGETGWSRAGASLSISARGLLALMFPRAGVNVSTRWCGFLFTLVVMSHPARRLSLPLVAPVPALLIRPGPTPRVRSAGNVSVDGHSQLTGHTNRVFSVKFNPADPSLVASAGWDKTVQVINSYAITVHAITM